MMSCTEARRLLLEVEPSALRGDGDTPLAIHLRGCRSCSTAAGVILSEGALLDAILSGRDAVEEVGARVASFPPVARNRVRTFVPLAAAALLAGVVLTRFPGIRPEPEAPSRQIVSPSALALVEVPEGRNAAVIPTSDPDLTIVWIY
ncbi:MAG: hypothetical protein OEZ65_14635 [Gemmatimonadota bacterium]|nr:hypothetical protein [Gemmatimonadota bacterium]MDH5760822.1 hypothetical protein [Gemmatimonadota bacterium]